MIGWERNKLSLSMKTTSELDEALEAAYLEIKPLDRGCSFSRSGSSRSTRAKGHSSDTMAKDVVIR